MVLFNYSTKELTAKIVYYGPGLCGKTTNLQFIHKNLPDDTRGKMLSLSTKTDRTLFFDFLPMDLGEIRGMRTRVQLYTVPGQVFYNETRKLVLKGADGIVFVADSQKEMLGPNVESFKNLEENLSGHGMELETTPHVIQFNKRDLPQISSIEEINASLNKYNAPFYESVATTGIGVHDTLKAITKLVLLHLTKKYNPDALEQLPEEHAEAAIPIESPDVPALVTPPPASPGAGAPLAAGAGSNVAPGAGVGAVSATADVAAESSTITAGDIDDLVDEVDDAVDLEIDVDEDLSVAAITAVEKRDETESAEIRLTEVLEDTELFDDPSLEVARLKRGQAQEIVVPVEVAGAGELQRFKLSIKLRLDPIE